MTSSFRALLALLLFLAACRTSPLPPLKPKKFSENASHRIPLDQIEVARFLNTYRQEHPEPSNDALSFTAENGREGETAILQLGIRAEAPNARNRRPLNVCWAIDRSRSMHEGGKLEEVKRGLRDFLRRMEPEDYLSIVAFDTEARVLLEPSKVVNKAAVEMIIDRLLPSGGSDVATGLCAGIRQVERWLTTLRMNRVLLITDTTLGVDRTWDREEVAGIRRSLREGIALDVVGLGNEWNDGLLYRMSVESEGNSFVARSSAEIASTLLKARESILPIAADEIKLLLFLKPDVAIEGVIGYPFLAETPLKVWVSLYPRMVSGTAQTALVRLNIPDEMGLFATATLYYRDPVGRREIHREIYLYREKKSISIQTRRNLAITRQAESLQRAYEFRLKQDEAGARRAIDETMTDLHSIYSLTHDIEIENDLERLRRYREKR